MCVTSGLVFCLIRHLHFTLPPCYEESLRSSRVSTDLQMCESKEVKELCGQPAACSTSPLTQRTADQGQSLDSQEVLQVK